MKPRFLCLVLITVLLGQTGGIPGPFVYCLADGELCCSGWGEEVCCEEGGTTPAGLCFDAVASCADVEADLNGMLGSIAPRVPDPSPDAIATFLGPDRIDPTPAPYAAPTVPGCASPDPHLRTTILRI